MRDAAIYLSGLFILLIQARTNSAIIGRWESVEPKEGLTVIQEFRSGGLYSRTIHITSHGTYAVEGNRIIDTFPPSPDAGTEEKRESIEFEIQGDDLVLRVKDYNQRDDEMRLKRLDHQNGGSASLAGRWGIKGAFFHGDNNGRFEMEFTKEGQLTIKMYREPDNGRYRISRDLLITTVDGERETNHFRFESGFLILNSATRTERYKRVNSN